MNRPGSSLGNAVGQGPATLPARIPNRPNWQGRPPVPDRPDRVLNMSDVRSNPHLDQYLNRLPGGIKGWENSRVGYWNNWHASRGNMINDYWSNHTARWNSISDFRRDHWNWIRQRTNEWNGWQASVWGYRLARAACVIDATRDFYCNLYTPDWWYGCGWWHRPAYVRPIDPWWWWRPYVWNSWSYVYSEPAPIPVTYDYGTDIVVEGDQVYVAGEPVASAADYRAQAVRDWECGDHGAARACGDGRGRRRSGCPSACGR